MDDKKGPIALVPVRSKGLIPGQYVGLVPDLAEALIPGEPEPPRGFTIVIEDFHEWLSATYHLPPKIPLQKEIKL